MFQDIQIGKKPDDYVLTYFLPKLTKEELDLVEKKDDDFMEIFASFMDADVDKAEMMLSESDSKFVFGDGWRQTFVIENSLPDISTEESIKNSSPENRTEELIEN